MCQHLEKLQSRDFKIYAQTIKIPKSSKSSEFEGRQKATKNMLTEYTDQNKGHVNMGSLSLTYMC